MYIINEGLEDVKIYVSYTVCEFKMGEPLGYYMGDLVKKNENAKEEYQCWNIIPDRDEPYMCMHMINDPLYKYYGMKIKNDKKNQKKIRL